MKLDSEDYENIYLRVREKLWLFWVALFGVLGGTGLVVAYISLGAATEKAVNKYMQTESFAKSIAENAGSRLARLEQRERELNIALGVAERRAGTLANLPISITESGITLSSPDGATYHIETGRTNKEKFVPFKSAS